MVFPFFHYILESDSHARDWLSPNMSRLGFGHHQTKYIALGHGMSWLSEGTKTSPLERTHVMYQHPLQGVLCLEAQYRSCGQDAPVGTDPGRCYVFLHASFL